MAKVKTWKTKADVLNDIAEATGMAPRNHDIAAQYIVVGDAPPPPLFMEDEDPEMNLMFGDSYRRSSVTENTGPDCAGIMQLLEMVRNSERNDDDEDADGIGDQLNYEITIRKPKTDSLLNPNVKEFVPKGAGKKNSNVLHANGVAQNGRAGMTSEQERDNGSSNSVTAETGTQASYEHITTALKNTISEAAHSDNQSFHMKKQKNVAIATLLRLYANNNNTSSKPDVKLWTPEQFEKKKDDSSDVKIEESNATTEVQASSSIQIEPITSPDSSNSIGPARALEQNSEMRESIEKVNHWFNMPVQKKQTKSLYLGPISFKRKDPVVKASTSPQPSTTSKSDSPSTTIKLYKPTKFAADLGKQYLERSQQKQRDEELNVNWANLGDVLEKKDKAIRKRLEAQMSPCTSNADS
ncbi:hypothetical protein HW555_005863 [Spodoptera exigua]|uniref:Uncharacterized protein n=1 Tax=Spodoptera exigua TaxID=7107 RepID=A0A835GG93_SPOEX|nr:hypothetical protein HW555_005863 [Spodoptera exigua]